MKYLKSFQEHSDYEDYLSNLTTEEPVPNVRYCIDEEDLHYRYIGISS